MNRPLLSLIAITTMTTAYAQPHAVSLASLTEGQIIGGFRATAVYLNAGDKPMGARFLHLKSGFTLDVLEIQSVPQAFVWVTTFPTSNMGEPHTQEHLLLGKGNKGRDVASRETMSLAASTAFTMQWRTCYSFYTDAGPQVFFDQTERRLDALLHPDYSDEEVRREVRNFGIAENPRDHSLRLEEKGSVYNEMVSSMDQPNYRIYRAANQMIYGPEHPLAFNSGGSPEALRVIQPSDIRKFHQEHYHLANMGMIASLPTNVPLASALASMDALLQRVEPQRPNRLVKTEQDLPAPQPAPAGEIRMVEYPHRNEQQPGSVWFVWPANRSFDVAGQELIDLFMSTLAGDPTTNLYKRFIDSKTREFDLGARGVFARCSNDTGHAVIVGFSDVPVTKMTPAALSDLRTRVLDEFTRIAAWKDGSPELADFNRRLLSQLTQERRVLSKFVNSPPTFGFRGSGSEWMEHLYQLNRKPGFAKSVTLKPELAQVEKLLASGRNVWAGLLAEWKLAGAEPFVLAAKPNTALAKQEADERTKRVNEETARLKEKYAVSDDQEAIRRYRTEYDANTAEIDKAAASIAPPRFVDNPPLTLDDQLDYKAEKAAGSVPMVASTFSSMTSATTGIALRMDVVPEDKLVFVTLLPQLLTRVGVIENGRPMPYEEMSERLKKEILALTANFAGNPRTGRVELALRGSGNDAAEAARSLEWMDLVLFHPDWRPANLPRIRDVVDQTLSALRRTMQSPEEYWVQGPAAAYWRQQRPLTLLTNSFMTQLHNTHRLRWMLKEGDAESRAAVANFLAALVGTKGTRDERKALLAAIVDGKAPQVTALPEPARQLAQDAARDLDLTLPDVPDASLDADWTYLCREMRADLSMTPEAALASLDQIRQLVLKRSNARLFLISSASTRTQLAPRIEALASALDPAPAVKATYRDNRRVVDRLQAREAGATQPVYVALINANSQGGVFLHSAPLAGFWDTDRNKLLDYLATNLYGGGGAHGIFMKTWAAGLAYSNGIRVRPSDGRLNYYAERTPELPQTLRFVIGELQHAPQPGQSLVEYAIAQAFAGSRAASPYEARGESMAADLADGVTPEVVTRFRKSILELRKEPKLGDEIFRRMNPAYGRVLPGLSGKTSAVEDGVYLVIGPDKQLAAWEEYLKTVEGAGTKLYRLYPRDFWMTAE